MNAGWSAFDAELKEWRRAGKRLRLWWRDDDAIAPTPALERLAVLAETYQIPVHLAVIPERAGPELAAFVAERALLVPVVHGWSHKNHASPEEKKSEFPANRPVDDALWEAEEGLTTLHRLFGDRLQPMFVPPWNRIAPQMLPWMAGVGYGALSGFGPRSQSHAAPGLAQVNTHIDPVDWKGTRGLLPADALLEQICTLLRARREGTSDNSEPLGLLSHHLIHDAALWGFCEELVSRLLSGPARPWRYSERIS